MYTSHVLYYLKRDSMKTLSGIALLIILVAATNLKAEPFCGEVYLVGIYGPFDYANPVHRKEYLPIVEEAHFTPDIKNLIKGETSSIGGDLSYTLRAFPNHYPALIAFAKLSLREKGAERPIGSDERYTVECYFDRAMRFKPGDAMLRAIYANYLQRLGGRQDDAMEQYQEAFRLQPENATT